MANWLPRSTGSSSALYAAVLEAERARWASYAERLGFDPKRPNWRVDAMERGDPVALRSYELPGSPSDYGLRVNDFVMLTADGSYTLIVAERGNVELPEPTDLATARRRRRGPQ